MPVAIPHSCRVSVKLPFFMFGGAPGRSSFNGYYELRDAERPDIIFCTGSSRIVWVDYAKGRSIVLPEPIRLLLPAPYRQLSRIHKIY